MGKLSKSKGARIEREIVTRLKNAGLNAKRYAPLQTFKDNGAPDIILEDAAGNKTNIEVKGRARGSQFYDWLGENDLLVYRVDRKQPLVIMTLENWITLFGGSQ